MMEFPRDLVRAIPTLRIAMEARARRRLPQVEMLAKRGHRHAMRILSGHLIAQS
jgi:hypothetical protein